MFNLLHILLILDSEDAPSGKVNRNLPPNIAKLLSETIMSTSLIGDKSLEPLFQLVYEYKPFNSSNDYKSVFLPDYSRRAIYLLNTRIKIYFSGYI